MGRRLVNLLPVAQRTNAFTLSYRGKRPIDYPAQSKPYNILPPLERRDLWDVSVDGSPYTVVRAYSTSIQILGTQGDMLTIRRMRKQFFEKKCSKWDSKFELVSSTMPNVSVEQYGPRDRLLLCRDASGSAHQVNHIRCLADAWKI